MERPVTGTAELLDRPGHSSTIAEVLLIVGDDVLQREVLAQRVVEVLVVALHVDNHGEIHLLVAGDDHTGGDHLVHGCHRSERAIVHIHRLVEVQRSGNQLDGTRIRGEIQRGTALVGDSDRNLV